MPSAHHRENVRTLRFRLTLWNTAVVFLFVLATLWGVREELRLFLWKEADEQLIEDAREVKETVEQLWPDDDRIHDELNRKAKTHVHRGLNFRIFDAGENITWTSANAPPVPFPASLLKNGLTPVTAEHYRLVHIRTEKPGVPVFTIR